MDKDDQAFIQANQWNEELRAIQRSLDKLVSKVGLNKGLSAHYVGNLMSVAYYTIGQIGYRNFKAIAEDNHGDQP